MRFRHPFRRHCPPLEDILRLVQGALPREKADALTSHVAECYACRRDSEWLQDVVQTAEAGPLPEPREESVERAVALFPRRAAREPARGWSLASLLRDSLAQPIPVGVRGEPAGARRLLYHAGGADLDLEIRPAAVGEPAFRVTGQLLPQGGPPAGDLLAVLWREQAVALHATSDAVGVFEFPRVPPGAYRLEVWVAGDERGIRVDPLELEAESP